MCNCIKDAEDKFFAHATKLCQDGKETIQPIKSWDGEGLLNTTFAMGAKGGISGHVMKTDYVFKSTFIKKDGSVSKPRNHHMTIVFSFCPFCGKPYKEEPKEEPAAQECDATDPQ